MSMSDDVTGAEEAPVTRNEGRRRRQKSYRHRRREGYRCVTIEIHRFTIGKLERNGYLEDGRDSLQLAKAVELFITDHMPP